MRMLNASLHASEDVDTVLHVEADSVALHASRASCLVSLNSRQCLSITLDVRSRKRVRLVAYKLRQSFCSMPSPLHAL